MPFLLDQKEDMLLLFSLYLMLLPSIFQTFTEKGKEKEKKNQRKR